MKKNGFTLIELMIVVAIIAILAAVALPSFGGQIKKSNDANAIKVLSAVRSSLIARINDDNLTTGIFPLSITDTAIYFAPALISQVEFSDTNYSDNITKMQVKAGTVRKGGMISAGTKGQLNGKADTIQFSYDNQTGLVTADGVSDTDTDTGYTDTKNNLWNTY